MAEDWVKIKVADVFSGGSASRIFHETSLSLVKIPCPAPPIFWVRICQNSAETQWLTQNKKSRLRLSILCTLQEMYRRALVNIKDCFTGLGQLSLSLSQCGTGIALQKLKSHLITESG